MKATHAQFHYGVSGVPVHEANRPEIDAAALEALIAPVVERMSELSGGFVLEQPTITLIVAGNGYDVTFIVPGTDEDGEDAEHTAQNASDPEGRD